MADNSTNIGTAANGPESAAADGQSFTSRSISAMVLGDQYQNAVIGAKKKNRGIRYTKMVGPGQTGIPDTGWRGGH